MIIKLCNPLDIIAIIITWLPRVLGRRGAEELAASGY